MQGDGEKLSFKVVDRPLSTLTVYNTGVHHCAAGYRWGPGVCDHYLFHYIISGKGAYTVGDKTIALAGGELFLIRPFELVTYWADITEPWTYCWVGFQGPDAGALLMQTDFSKERLVQRIEEGKTVERLLLDIVDSRGSQPHDVARMTGKLYAFFAFLMERATDMSGGRRPSGQEHARRACDYIATHYSRDITVQDMALHVGVSRSQLYRAFDEQLQCSPIQYLTRFRMRQACVLLKKGALSVKEVAYSVGFEDPLYFSRRFREIVGCPPGRYAVKS